MLGRYRPGADPHELLDAPTLTVLGRVNVALVVDGDAAELPEMAGITTARAEGGLHLERRAEEDVDALVHLVRHVHPALVVVLGERDVAHGAGTERVRRDHDLLDERAIGLEHLDAVVPLIA